MIQCDDCDVWYHGTCVDISSHHAVSTSIGHESVVNSNVVPESLEQNLDRGQNY